MKKTKPDIMAKQLFLVGLPFTRSYICMELFCLLNKVRYLGKKKLEMWIDFTDFSLKSLSALHFEAVFSKDESSILEKISKNKNITSRQSS